MNEGEAKRQCVSALVDADLPKNEICQVFNCRRFQVVKVKKLQNGGEDLQRKPGSGGNNKTRSEELLTGLAAEIEANPTTSMRELAKVTRVDPKTVRTAIKDDLGLVSYLDHKCQAQSSQERDHAAQVAEGRPLQINCDPQIRQICHHLTYLSRAWLRARLVPLPTRMWTP